MTMGSRIKAARLERGLSQRQLAGDEITRNMLSALENDTANPSVATLKYLSEKLGKPVGYFLGETLPGQGEMAKARAAFQTGQYQDCLDALERVDGGAFSLEKGLLRTLTLMALAETAIREQRLPYAKGLLECAWEAAEGNPYFTPAQQRQWKLLYARTGGGLTLTGEDEALVLRARQALEDGHEELAQRLLEAVEQRDPEWSCLLGEVHFARKDYEQAARCYHAAEGQYPVRERLEVCYREMEDYKMAYFYAKKGKSDMKDREMFSECQGGEMLRGGAGSRGKMAADKFLAGYNCAQAVAVAFRDVTGLGERDTARMVSAFGGGMGRMREVCGAVSGMLFVLSWLYGYDQPGDDESKKVLYTRVQALAGEFRGRTGSVICRELLENPASDPNPTPRTADFYAERPCARFVYQAADILEKFIEENPVHG